MVHGLGAFEPSPLSRSALEMRGDSRLFLAGSHKGTPLFASIGINCRSGQCGLGNEFNALNSRARARKMGRPENTLP